MRDGPDSTTLAGAVTWRPSLSSWLADVLLADDIPIIGGTLTVDVTQEVPETLTFTVPEWAEGRSWIPLLSNDPLAKFGQQIDLQVAVTAPVTQNEWLVRIGRFQIQDWERNDLDGTIQVTALGMLQIVADDLFITPEVPRSGDTFVSAFTRLVSDGVGVNFDAGLVDRPLPQSFQWDQDRLGALYDIADAWPARIRTDQYGTVQVLGTLPDVPTSVLTLTDGEGGTLIGAPSSDTRDKVYNVVVAQASNTDDPAHAQIQAVAQVIGGPLDPSTYNRSVRFYSSPLITTTAQAQAAAVEILRSSVRPALSRVATTPPDPRLDLDDTVTLIQSPAGLNVSTVSIGWVQGYTMPLTVGDGPMTITIGTVVWS